MRTIFDVDIYGVCDVSLRLKAKRARVLEALAVRPELEPLITRSDKVLLFSPETAHQAVQLVSSRKRREDATPETPKPLSEIPPTLICGQPFYTLAQVGEASGVTIRTMRYLRHQTTMLDGLFESFNGGISFSKENFDDVCAALQGAFRRRKSKNNKKEQQEL